MIKKFIPRIIATLLIITIGLLFTSCNKKPTVSTNGGVDMPKVNYEFVLTYAAHGIGDQNILNANSLNIAQVSSDPAKHTPIFKFESKTELDNFKSGILMHYDLSATHNDVTSLNAATKNYDEAHFEKNTVFLIAIPATSGSVRHKISKIDVSDGQLTAFVKAESPNAVTMDLVSWFIVVSIDKTTASNCAVFDAVLE